MNYEAVLNYLLFFGAVYLLAPQYLGHTAAVVLVLRVVFSWWKQYQDRNLPWRQW